jgi:hemoglobin
MPKHAALPGLSADLFGRWLTLFGETTATLANAPMRERANDLAQRIAESLWYGYQMMRGAGPLPQAS